MKFEYFHLTTEAIIDTYLPVRHKTISTNDKPWITPGYRNLIAHRQEALKSGNKEKYKKLRNECNRKAPLLKAGFYQRWTMFVMIGM